MVKYQLNLRLRRMAAIQIAKELWYRSQLKHAVKQERDPSDDDFYPLARFCRRNRQPANDVTLEHVYTSITYKIDQLLLPEALKDELRFVAASMGTHITNWFNLLVNRDHRSIEYEFDKHVEHIQWTSLGTIDQTETVRSMYKAKTLLETSHTFKKLSYYCVEDCVRALQPKIHDEIHVTDTSFNISPLRFAFPFIMPFYWDRHLTNSTEEIIAQLKHACAEMRYYDYDESYTPNENLCIMSILAGNYWALRYFWGLLDCHQKARTMAKLSSNQNCQKQIEEQWVAKDIEVIVFLFQQLSFYGLNDLLFIMLRSEVIIRKLLKWPWYNLFLDVVEDIWNYHPTFNHASIISGILGALKDLKKIPSTCIDYHIIFRKIWETNPFDMRRTLDYGKIIKDAIQHQAITGLHLIINADELKDRRKEFIDCALQAFKDSCEDLNSLELFAKLILANEEQQPFKAEVIAEYEDRKQRYFMVYNEPLLQS